MEDLLSYYRYDMRVMHIAGSNLQQGFKSDNASYYFSHIPWVWGWASWKRAWKYYDVNISSYKKVIMEEDHQLFHHKEMVFHYKQIFNAVYADGANTGDSRWARTVWDYQWFYTVNVQHGLCIQPNENLISNIGFTKDALHTKEPDHPYNNIPVVPMEFPLIHPKEMYPNEQADLLMILREVASKSVLRWMARSLLKEWLPGFIQDWKLLLKARRINKRYKQ
ncbi:MAG: hypothetical protein J6S58_00330 [Lentisphaeria bacterium]|nr:hypothetical protein [Lentisphaeria bacterium]